MTLYRHLVVTIRERKILVFEHADIILIPIFCVIITINIEKRKLKRSRQKIDSLN